MDENFENAPMYLFGSQRLANLHERATEMQVFKSTFKREFDGFIYRVLYPGEFILVQKMIHGQVVPLTLKEIIL